MSTRKETNLIDVQLTELDLEVIWMALVDAEQDVRNRREKWANSNAKLAKKQAIDVSCCNVEARLHSVKEVVSHALRTGRRR